MTDAPGGFSGIAAETILAFDATGDDCAALVWSVDAGVLGEVREPMPRGGGAELAIDVVARAVATAGLDWSAIGLIVVVTGPGSFTGVRIGVAAARGLALSLDIPAIGVDAFDAISTAFAEDPMARVGVRAIAVVFGRPARLVWRRYKVDAGAARGLGGSESGDAGMLRHVTVDCFTGPSAAAAEPKRVEIRQPDLRIVARIGAARAATGANAPPTPLYLRAPDAKPPSLIPPVRLDPQ